MLPWRHRTISAGLGLLGATRLDRALRPLARGRGVILMLHSVKPACPDAFRPNAALEITPEFLGLTLDLFAREGFEFVSLDAVPERLRRGGGDPPFAAVTFDDGYRDNRDYALPVLQARGIPWTVYVTTEFAAGTGRVWWVEMERAVGRLDTIRLRGPEGDAVLEARTVAQKYRAFSIIHARARASSRRALLDDMNRLCDDAELDPAAIVRELCMDWGELAALSGRPGVQIGAHAITHHALARLWPAEARREIVRGRRILQDHLGLPIRHLAYPFGDPGAAGSREFELAREAGFATAVTTQPGHVSIRHAHHLQALPRVSINGHFQRESKVRTLASGVPFLSNAFSSKTGTLGAKKWRPSRGDISLGSS